MMRAIILAAGGSAFFLLVVLCITRHLTLTATSEDFNPPASFHAQLDRETLILRGTLPSESTKVAILKRAQELYGTPRGHVIDELVIDPRANSAIWIGMVPNMISILNPIKKRWSIMIAGHSIVLSGQIDTEQKKARILREIAPLMQTGLELEDHIVLTPLSLSLASLQKKLNAILALGPIEFDSNTDTITLQSHPTLDRLVSLLRQTPHSVIEIGGHTDKYGTPDYNVQLSQHRAESVRKYLISHKTETQLISIGYGASQPLSQAQSRVGIQHDRRIELLVKKAEN